MNECARAPFEPQSISDPSTRPATRDERRRAHALRRAQGVTGPCARFELPWRERYLRSRTLPLTAS